MPIRSSSEFVSINGATESGPELPVPLYGHCLLPITNTTVFIIGGKSSVDSMDDGLKSTFYYDFVQNIWNDGPEMIQARNAFGCGSFFSEYHDGKKVFAAIGKYLINVEKLPKYFIITMEV